MESRRYVAWIHRGNLHGVWGAIVMVIWTGIATTLGFPGVGGKLWLIPIAALIGLGWAMKAAIFPGALNLAGLLLLLAGILGNLTDRLLHGYVVDFLFFDFGFPPFNPWPAFNVADSCICIAVGCLMLATFFDGSSKSEPIDEPKA